MEKQDDQDDQEAEDAEDAKEEDDGSTHATVVANPAETTKPQGEREALERTNPTNQAKTKAKTKAKAVATTETRRRRRGSRLPACHRQIRDQINHAKTLGSKQCVQT